MADVICRIVVLDRAIKPFTAIGTEDVAGFDPHRGWNVWMPAVVANDLLVSEFLGVIQREKILGHGNLKKVP